MILRFLLLSQPLFAMSFFSAILSGSLTADIVDIIKTEVAPAKNDLTILDAFHQNTSENSSALTFAMLDECLKHPLSSHESGETVKVK